MYKDSAQIAILDDDRNLFELLKENNNSDIEFVYFDDIEQAKEYISNNRIVCVLTETIINNLPSTALVQVLRNDKLKPNYNAPIILYSSRINSSFIGRVRDKVLAAFKKPITTKESFEKFIPLLIHVFKQKKKLHSLITELFKSHNELVEHLGVFLEDQSIKETAEKTLLAEFLQDLQDKSSYFNEQISPHLEEAFSDQFNENDLIDAIKSLSLNDSSMKKRGETTESLKVYKYSQQEIQIINSKFTNAFLKDPGIEDPNLYKAELDEIFQNQIFEAIENEELETFRALMATSPKLAISNQDGDTPLHLISVNGNMDFFNLVIDHTSSLNTVNKNGETPLFKAIYAGNREIANKLLVENCKVNERDIKGRTPLMIACDAGNIEFTIDLVSAGAQIDLINYDGKSAIEIAEKKGHKQIVKFLKKF